jgi:hypothetical protein
MSNNPITDQLNLLLEIKGLPAVEQIKRRAEASAAFKVLLAQNPGEEEFVHFTSGLVLTPEIIYAVWSSARVR